MSIVSYVAHQLAHNPFAGAAVVGAPVAALSYSVRKIPGQIAKKFRRQVSLSVRFNSDQTLYTEAVSFITERVIRERFTRDYVLSSKGYTVFSSDHQGKVFVNSTANVVTSRSLEIGYGTHIGFYRRHPVFIRRNLESESKGDAFKEYFICSFLTRSKSIVESFLKDIALFTEEKKKTEPGVVVHINQGKSWESVDKLPLRSLQTIFLPQNPGHVVVQHIRGFEEKRDWNHTKGLPHHTGIILHGPPGGGKSSLIHAVSSETGRQIAYLNFAGLQSDNDIAVLFSGINCNKCLLVIEDIDAMGLDLDRHQDDASKPHYEQKQKISLSTLLNSLDGLMAPDGMIVIATTNHISRLDPALVRPGRFDLTIEIGLLGKPEFVEMAKFFDHNPEDYTLENFAPMSGATMRTLLLEGGIPAVEEYQKQHQTRH